MKIPDISNVRKVIYFGLVLMGVFSMARAADGDPLLETVAKVDLSRYLGHWYEIAKYQNRFERKCERDVTATYAVRADGKISVVNRCTTHDGKVTESNGWAKVVDQETNAKLKVTFFWPFFGDYWIIDLGANYEYAVIGEPSRKYLWILSRSAKMDDAVYAGIAKRLKEKGYDASKLERMTQTD
jgi:apolipoprotein D and lipocalin family protein